MGATFWLQRKAGSGIRAAAEHILFTLDIRPARSAELGSKMCIARSVAAGAGIAILPRRAVRDPLRLGELAERAGPAANGTVWLRPLWLLQLQDRPQSPPARAFSKLVDNSPTSAQAGKPSKVAP
ncbi:MAG: LysR substrate-binding domain-containing protein [Burkholderiales bacterium]